MTKIKDMTDAKLVEAVAREVVQLNVDYIDCGDDGIPFVHYQNLFLRRR